MVPYVMARIEASGSILEIPDCDRGGNHDSLLNHTANVVLEDNRVLSSDTPCPECNLEVIVRRHPNTGDISASLEQPLTDSWLGM